MKTYALMILGCKVNDYEATYVREQMNKNYREVSFKSNADIYIIFTCCVTNTAESKTRKYIHDARRNNPNSFICAVGCLCQIKSNEEVFNNVDLIIGSDNKEKIAELINAGIKNNYVHEQISNNFENLYITDYPNKSRAFLKIQDGCNQFCSYCIIPYARGRERSLNHIDAINEAKQLSKSCNEIVLTGIHTGRYNDGAYNLYKLLFDLCKIDDLKTIRLSSIEITEISDDIISLIKNSNKIAHHLHIPVQSCCNNVLKNMNRPYTIEEYINRIEYIKKQVPDISISTDLIVGFPQESNNDFEETINNINKISFSFIHIFPYSRKTGTDADKMIGHIEPKIIKSRCKYVQEVNDALKKKYINTLIGKEVDVLIEKVDEKYSYGYCKQYVYCKIKGEYIIGEIVKIILKKENIYES